MITRKRLAVYLATGLSGVPFVRRPSDAAEFTVRLATNEPLSHPTSARALEAAAQIKRESSKAGLYAQWRTTFGSDA